MAETQRRSILSEDPRGRLDIAAARLLERFVKTQVEPRCKNVQLWDGGVGEIVEAFLKEQGVPNTPLTPTDIARRIGLLKPVPPKRRLRNVR